MSCWGHITSHLADSFTGNITHIGHPCREQDYVQLLPSNHIQGVDFQSPLKTNSFINNKIVRLKEQNKTLTSRLVLRTTTYGAFIK